MEYVLVNGMNICEQGSGFFLRREIGRPACRSVEREGDIKRVVWKVYGPKTGDREDSVENHDE